MLNSDPALALPKPARSQTRPSTRPAIARTRARSRSPGFATAIVVAIWFAFYFWSLCRERRVHDGTLSLPIPASDHDGRRAR